LQVSYKTALFMMHRLRHAMEPTGPEPKLTGEVEVDETHIGPRKPRYPRGNHNRVKAFRGTLKPPVLAMVQKGGKVRTKVIPDVTGKTLRQAMRENIDPSAIITTDEWTGYSRTGQYFAGHKTVNHRSKEYVKSDGTTTNTGEPYFSRVKRCLNGTWHAVSREHLHRYMTHVAFLYNTRDGERTIALLRAMNGKRLMYRDPMADESRDLPEPDPQLPPFPDSATG
jgi:hypothetical protein